MKKWYVGIWIGLLSLSLAACGKQSTPDAPPTDFVDQTQEQPAADMQDEETADASSAGSDEQDTENADASSAGSDAAAQEGTPAKILLAVFTDRMEEGSVSSTEDMANALLKNQVIPFMGAVMPVKPGFLTGFTDEIKGFSEGTMFGPSIGAIPFVGYIFKVDGDIDAFTEELRSKADRRWNICTEADEMICEAQGDTVFFVMAPAAFEDQ